MNQPWRILRRDSRPHSESLPQAGECAAGAGGDGKIAPVKRRNFLKVIAGPAAAMVFWPKRSRANPDLHPFIVGARIEHEIEEPDYLDIINRLG